MKAFAKIVAADSAFWISIYAYMFMDSPYREYGENYASFYGALMLIFGVIILFLYKSTARSMADAGEYIRPSKALRLYGLIETSISVVITSALGWYFVAAGLLISAFSVRAFRQEAERIIKESK